MVERRPALRTGYEIQFPQGSVLAHSSKIDTIDWATQGPATERDIGEMTGYFWKTKDTNAFGAYTPSLGTGLYHVADESVAPGIKLWSYGADSDWAILSTARQQTYVEIQGGPLGDQSIKAELEPAQTRSHVEFWFPADRELDIHALRVPPVALRALRRFHCLNGPARRTSKIWQELSEAYRARSRTKPEPPPVDRNLWAPSGMEDLDQPFQWAIAGQQRRNTGPLAFHYGAWLAGSGNTDAAICGVLAGENRCSQSHAREVAESEGRQRRRAAGLW